MKFAYADPPYLGMAARYYADHPDHAVYDTEDGHRALIERLSEEFPDGWALSLSSVTLRTILPMCPPDVRVMAWCKSFVTLKGKNPVYAWEPVIVRGGRPWPRLSPTRDGNSPMVRDYLVEPITLRRGFPGAKPEKFVYWVLSLLNVQPDDEFMDLFPGSGAVGEAWDSWRRQLPLALVR